MWVSYYMLDIQINIFEFENCSSFVSHFSNILLIHQDFLQRKNSIPFKVIQNKNFFFFNQDA